MVYFLNKFRRYPHYIAEGHVLSYLAHTTKCNIKTTFLSPSTKALGVNAVTLLSATVFGLIFMCDVVTVRHRKKF